MTISNPRKVPQCKLNPLELQVRKVDGLISSGQMECYKGYSEMVMEDSLFLTMLTLSFSNIFGPFDSLMEWRELGFDYGLVGDSRMFKFGRVSMFVVEGSMNVHGDLRVILSGIRF
ncbi:hypothetical protein ACFE04_004539 [Oxalis oulophora]